MKKFAELEQKEKNEVIIASLLLPFLTLKKQALKIFNSLDRKKKRVTASILSVVLVITMTPLSVFNAFAEPTTGLSVSASSIYLREDSGNKQYSTDQINWTTYTGSFEITGSTTSNTVNVSGSHDIILNDVNIDNSANYRVSALKIENSNAGDVSITLAQGTTNTLKGGSYGCGIEKNGIGTDIGNLTIKGNGTLNAVGGLFSSAIGSVFNFGTSNITIESGYINAVAGSGSAGIGGGYEGDCDNIAINGGTIYAKGDHYGAAIGSGENHVATNISITGGSINAKSNNSVPSIGSAGKYDNGWIDGVVCIPTDGKGNNVYLTTVELKNANSTELTSLESIDGYGLNDVETDENGKLYLWLPENTATTSAVADKGTFNGSVVTTNDNLASGVLSQDLVVTNGERNTDYTYKGNVLTILTDTQMSITGTTSTDYIVIPDGTTANITIDGLSMTNMKVTPIKVSDNATLNLTVSGESTITAASNTWIAGINVLSTATLKIDGNGKLNVRGGYSGAAIGSASEQGNGKVIIDGGTITADGGSFGAGIGGGHSGKAGTIIINGGNITATGNYSAAIGNGDHCGTDTGSSITINGGTIKATGGGGSAGIGDGRMADWERACAITINGGTITSTGGSNSAGIGGGNQRGGGPITINGGTVVANGTNGATGIGAGNSSSANTAVVITGGSVKVNNPISSPKDGNGNDIYLTTVTINGNSGAISNIKINSISQSAYGMNDIKTDASGNIYLYLKNEELISTATDTNSINYYGKIVTNNENSANGTLSLPINPTITTTSLPNANNTSDYSVQLEATGNPNDFSWSISEGTIPNGITLSTGGLLSGNPNESGSFTFTVLVSNGIANAEKQFTLVVDSSYIVTIPSEATINSDSYTIKVENVLLPKNTTMKIFMTATSDENNDFVLVNKGGSKINYSVKSSDNSTTYNLYEPLIMLSKGSDETAIKFDTDETKIGRSGSYSGTLTFTVAMSQVA